MGSGLILVVAVFLWTGGGAGRFFISAVFFIVNIVIIIDIFDSVVVVFVAIVAIIATVAIVATFIAIFDAVIAIYVSIFDAVVAVVATIIHAVVANFHGIGIGTIGASIFIVRVGESVDSWFPINHTTQP